MKRKAMVLAALLLLAACGSDDYRVGTGSTNEDGIYEVTVYLDEPLDDKGYEDISRELWTEHGAVHIAFKCESNDRTLATSHQETVLGFTGRRFDVTC